MSRRLRIGSEITAKIESPFFEISQRQYRNAALREAKRPLTGPYYWIPLPDGSWDLLEFYDDDYGGYVDHSGVWEQVLLTLAMKWQKDPAKLKQVLANAMFGLPRGRVVKLQGLNWGIAHGQDEPVGTDLKQVKRAYNITQVATREWLDDHERMLPDMANQVQEVLGKDLELKVPSAEELWDEDDLIDLGEVASG